MSHRHINLVELPFEDGISIFYKSDSYRIFDVCHRYEDTKESDLVGQKICALVPFQHMRKSAIRNFALIGADLSSADIYPSQVLSYMLLGDTELYLSAAADQDGIRPLGQICEAYSDTLSESVLNSYKGLYLLGGCSKEDLESGRRIGFPIAQELSVNNPYPLLTDGEKIIPINSPFDEFTFTKQTPVRQYRQPASQVYSCRQARFSGT